MQLTVVLVFKGILEKYQFLVGLPDKTCIGFESDIFSDLTLTFEKAAKVVLNSKKRKLKYLSSDCPQVKLAELFSLKVVNLNILLSVTLLDSKDHYTI